jgi:tRNA/rRNA methyltransferase
MITFVLVEPENSGNIGAIARAMKNFAFEKLVLINPKAEHLNDEALNRASHAKDILKRALVKDFKYLETFDYLVATSALLGSDYNIPRNAINPEELAQIMPKKGNIAILIGRESSGLRNEEIKKCDFIVTIPSSRKYGTLNASHASCILMYELFKKSKKKKTNDQLNPAKKHDKDVLLKKIDEVLDSMEFSTKEKKETQKILWKRLVGKSFLSRRELFAMFGFFKKVKK